MSDQNSEYGVFFSGKVQAGQSVDEVRARMATLFRLGDSSRLDRHFSGARVLLKGGLTLEQAGDYSKAVAQTGAVVEVARITAPPADRAGRPSVVPPAPPPAAESGTEKIWMIIGPGAARGPYSRSEVISLGSAGDMREGDKLQQAGSVQLIEPVTVPWLVPALGQGKKSGKLSAGQKQLAALAAVNRRNAGRRENATRDGDISHRRRVRMLLAWYLLMPAALVILNRQMTAYDITSGKRYFYIVMLYVLPGLLLWLEDLRDVADNSQRRFRLMAGAMIFSAVLAALAYHGITLGLRSPAGADDFALADSELQGLARSINNTVPQQLDESARLDGASYADNTLRNKLTLTGIDAASADKNSISQYAWSRAAKTSCWNGRLAATLRDKGLTIAYDFYDRNGQLVVSVPVNYSACTSPHVAPASLSLAAQSPVAAAAPDQASGPEAQAPTDTTMAPVADAGAAGADATATTAPPAQP